MSDLISLLGGGQQSQSDLLVDAFKRTQKPKLDLIKQKQTGLEQRRSFLTALNTRLNSIVSEIDKFQSSEINQKFITRKSTSNESDFVTASASGSAIVGNTSVKVNRLASSDLLASNRVNINDDFGAYSGTFTLSIGTADDIRNIEVTLTGDETYEEAMNKIVAAVNSEEDFDISAGVVKDTSSTMRLTFTSRSTGEDNKIIFQNSANPADDLLLNLGFDESLLNPNSSTRLEFNDSDAGYKISSSSILNSEAEINGINVTRNSNNLDDVINGLTITLKKVQDNDATPAIINTEIDVQAVVDLINPLLTRYNETLSYLNSNKDIRRQDASVNSLFSRLRGISSSQVTGLDADAPNILSAIGIKTETNGNLTMGDKDRLKEVLEQDPNLVAQLFTSEDGVVAKINQAIASLKGEDNLIETKRSNLLSQIDSYSKRFKDLEQRVEIQAQNLRKQYETSLKLLIEAQNQFGSLSQVSLLSQQGSLGGGLF